MIIHKLTRSITALMQTDVNNINHSVSCVDFLSLIKMKIKANVHGRKSWISGELNIAVKCLTMSEHQYELKSLLNLYFTYLLSPCMSIYSTALNQMCFSKHKTDRLATVLLCFHNSNSVTVKDTRCLIVRLTHWWCRSDSPSAQQRIPAMENINTDN